MERKNIFRQLLEKFIDIRDFAVGDQNRGIGVNSFKAVWVCCHVRRNIPAVNSIAFGNLAGRFQTLTFFLVS